MKYNTCFAFVLILSSALRPLGGAYVLILLSELQQEERPSGNGDCEAIEVGAGFCDGEGERAYTAYVPHFYMFAFRKEKQEKRLKLSTLYLKNMINFRRHSCFVLRWFSSDVLSAATYFDNFLIIKICFFDSFIFGFHPGSDWQFGVENKPMVPWR